MRLSGLSAVFLLLLGSALDAAPKKSTENLRLYTPELVYSAAVFFEYGKATIRKSSFTELEALKELLQKDPSLSFEFVVRKQDPPPYALQLQKSRAQNIIAYLVEKGGIERARLSISWYSERCPSSKDKDYQRIDVVVKKDGLDGCVPYSPTSQPSKIE